MYKYIAILFFLVWWNNEVSGQMHDTLIVNGGHEIGWLSIERGIYNDSIFADVNEPCKPFLDILLHIKLDSIDENRTMYGHVLEADIYNIYVTWPEGGRYIFAIGRNCNDSCIHYTAIDKKNRRMLKKEQYVWEQLYILLNVIVKDLYSGKPFKSTRKIIESENGEQYIVVNEDMIGIVYPFKKQCK